MLNRSPCLLNALLLAHLGLVFSSPAAADNTGALETAAISAQSSFAPGGPDILQQSQTVLNQNINDLNRALGGIGDDNIPIISEIPGGVSISDILAALNLPQLPDVLGNGGLDDILRTIFNPNNGDNTGLPNTATTLPGGNTANADSSRIRSLIASLGQFIPQLDGIVNAALNATKGALNLPDLDQSRQTILAAPTSADPGARTAEALGNQLPGLGSYVIRTSIADQAEQESVIRAAFASTLGTQAQEAAVAANQVAAQAYADTQTLGEESQSLDVTQQIMQNLSQQLVNEASIDQLLHIEAQQARIDRNLNNVITTQAVRQLQQRNLTEQRASIAGGRSANQAASLFILPGGYYLGSQDDSADNP